MTGESKPWEQQPEEPDASFARFLAYCNLGPSRSIDAAYRAYRGGAEGSERLQAPGQWARESVRWNWVARADAWDVAVLSEAGRKAAVRFVALIGALAARGLEAALSGTLKPESWQDLLDTANALANLIPPETIRAVHDPAADGGDPAPIPIGPTHLAG